MDIEMIAWNVISILCSGMISFFIAKFVRVEASLKVNLQPEDKKSSNALMVKFWSERNRDLADKTLLFKLTIKTGFVRGVTFHNVYQEKKPSLRFEGVEILDVQTLNNDGSRFHIPIGISNDKSTLIFNVNWIRKRTHAEFLVFCKPKDGMPKMNVRARLYPGLLHEVNVLTSGIIDKQFADNCYLVRHKKVLHSKDAFNKNV